MQVQSFFCGKGCSLHEREDQIYATIVASCKIAFTARLALPIRPHYEASILPSVAVRGS